MYLLGTEQIDRNKDCSQCDQDTHKGKALALAGNRNRSNGKRSNGKRGNPLRTAVFAQPLDSGCLVVAVPAELQDVLTLAVLDSLGLGHGSYVSFYFWFGVFTT